MHFKIAELSTERVIFTLHTHHSFVTRCTLAKEPKCQCLNVLCFGCCRPTNRYRTAQRARALSLLWSLVSTLTSELESTGSLPCSSLKATEPTGVLSPVSTESSRARSSSVAWSSVGGAVIRRSAFATLYIPEDISAAKFRRLGAVQLWRYSYCYSNFQLYILRIWSRSLSGAGFHLFPIPIAPHLGSPPLSRFASFPSKFPLLPISGIPSGPNPGSFPTPPS